MVSYNPRTKEKFIRSFFPLQLQHRRSKLTATFSYKTVVRFQTGDATMSRPVLWPT